MDQADLLISAFTPANKVINLSNIQREDIISSILHLLENLPFSEATMSLIFLFPVGMVELNEKTLQTFPSFSLYQLAV